MTRVLGPETADRESEADERYLADLVDALARPRLHGPRGLAPRPRPRRRAGQPPAPRPGRPAGRRLARARHGPRPAAGPDRRPGPAPPGRADAHRPPRPGRPGGLLGGRGVAELGMILCVCEARVCGSHSLRLTFTRVTQTAALRGVLNRRIWLVRWAMFRALCGPGSSRSYGCGVLRDRIEGLTDRPGQCHGDIRSF